MRAGEGMFVAAQAGSGRQRQVAAKATIDATSTSTEIVAKGECVENAGDGNDWESGEQGR